jgi:AcrR family transcriptional regulator
VPARQKKTRQPDARTREAILLAATEEFAERGFDGARTEHIAKKARVNKAMLHYYYHDKQTLYSAVLERLYGSDSETELLIEKLSSAALNSVQMVHIFIKIILKKHADRRSEAFRRILAWELAAGRNNLKDVAQKYMVPRIAAMAEVIRRGVAQGELSCSNPTLAVWSIISQLAFYFMHRETYEGSSIYQELYADVSPEDLLNFVLGNFIAAYATKKNIRSDLPAEIESLTDILAEKLITPALPQGK